MNALARFLAPRPLTVAVFLGLFVALGFVQSKQLHLNDPNEFGNGPRILGSYIYYGIGAPIQRYEDLLGIVTYSVRSWGLLALNLAAAYLLASLVTSFTYATIRWRRHLLVYSILAFLAVAGAAIGVLASCYYHRGYVFQPPGNVSGFDDIAQVDDHLAFDVFREFGNPNHAFLFVEVTNYKDPEEILLKPLYSRRFAFPVRRNPEFVKELKARRLLPAKLSTEFPTATPPLVKLLEQNRYLSDLDFSDLYKGLAILARARDGRRLLFLDFNGPEEDGLQAYLQVLYVAPAGSENYRLSEHLTYRYNRHGRSFPYLYSWLEATGGALIVLCGGLAALTGLARILPRWWWPQRKVAA